MEESCQDRQENEKAALLAIYGDQMKLCQRDYADPWIPLECILRLCTPSSEGLPSSAGPSVELHITCPFDYPNVLPCIDLTNPKKLASRDLNFLKTDLVHLANTLKGEVMIFELAQHVENALCSYNEPQYESFYEEMISRNKKNEEIELLKRQADEEKKLKDIRIKIQHEQQAVRKALRKKSTTSSTLAGTKRTSLAPQIQEHLTVEKPSEENPVHLSSNVNNDDLVPWSFPHGEHSRFKDEFEHINWLGKGAFGDVLKVRNKLDDGFYAIKRITLNPHTRQLNKKMTREVKLLSRLNHENVVRYYNSWLEVTLPEKTECDEEHVKETKHKNSNDDVVTVENQREWSIDKASEGSYDESSDDTWIAFRSSSKTSNNQPESILPTSDVSDHTPQQPRVRTLLHMYIQMELCEKSTLRIAIDEGLYKDVDRVWRLFREIAEGLCHIHHQGIIHRDLKPVNIFIGQDDHVKIGDFGLATTIILQKHSAENILEKSGNTTFSMQQGKDISHTGQVGTAFYVAPELNQTNKSHYNQKVDIFSLGIIFFEMCHPPFLTSMERCKILNDIRLEAPFFPKDFQYTHSSHQFCLIRWMLHHDVKKRPSAQEVLQSEMIPPPQLEEAEVKEMVRRTLSNPQSKDYKYLIASCFKQEMPPTLDATFNVSSWRSSWFMSVAESISVVIRKIFKNHGAISFLPPLLTPTKDPPENAVSLMTRLGSIVFATFDIRIPFVRFLSHNPGVCNMKRYAIDKVYKERPAGVHPKEVYECAFDIVTSNSGDLMPEFELIATAWEILCEFPFVLKKNAVIRINHTNLIYAVLNHSGLDKSKCEVIVRHLFKVDSEFGSSIDILVKLKSYGVADNVITSVINLVEVEGTLREVASKLEPLTAIADVCVALQQIETLIGYCHSLEITCPMIVSLRLLQNTHNYSGIMFNVTFDQLSKQKQIQHVILAGGRYDKLLRDSNHILSNEEGMCEKYVAGFNLSIDKLVLSFNACERPNSADILLCSMGPIRMTPDRLHLIRDLWKSGLRTFFINSIQTLEEIQLYCQDLGILFIVILKESEPGFARVRSFNTDKFSDKKIPYSELMEYIKRNLSKSNSEVNSVPSVSKVRDSPVITFVLTEKLNPGAKRRYENQVMNIISPALQKLSSNVKVEVLVITLEKEALLTFYCCLDIHAAEQDINNFIKKYPRQKKYGQKILGHFEDCKRSQNPPVLFLYSLQENMYKVLL